MIEYLAFIELEAYLTAFSGVKEERCGLFMSKSFSAVEHFFQIVS
jgi:hypothetical protein